MTAFGLGCVRYHTLGKIILREGGGRRKTTILCVGSQSSLRNGVSGGRLISESRSMLFSQNKYLAALPLSVQKYWRPHLSIVECAKGQYLPLDGEISLIYFPIRFVSLVHIATDRHTEMFYRFTGSEFLIGSLQIQEITTLRVRAKVCYAGYGLSLPMQVFQDTTVADTPQFHLINLARLAEKAVHAEYCTASHTGSQRLARLLLEAADAFCHLGLVALSQVELGDILKVRRETIGAILFRWSEQQIITVTRNKVNIHDSEALRRLACSCVAIGGSLQAAEIRSWRNPTWQ